jgi:DNA-binding LacI/PurR family transcriptional regulator
MNNGIAQKTDSQPLYKHIHDYLLEKISSGKLEVGAKLPSEQELCAQFEVSRITSKKALELLANEGFITRFPGKGTFVAVPGEHKFSGDSGRTIAFVTPGFSDAFGTRLVYSIESACNSLGYHLVLKCTKDSTPEEEKALQSLNDAEVAGILLMPSHGEYYNSEILKQILNKRPLVFVDRRMKGLPVPSVSTDNIAAAEIAVEYLLRLGHRNIAFYSGPVEYNSSVEDRRQGFIKTFADYGISLDPVLFCSDLRCTELSAAADIALIERQLSAHPEITAAFATEYAIALLIRNAALSLGRVIPDDFSIISVDSTNDMGSALFTHLRQDEEEIGRQAVTYLHDIITGADPTSFGDIRIPACLVTGKSVSEVRECEKYPR